MESYPRIFKSSYNMDLATKKTASKFPHMNSQTIFSIVGHSSKELGVQSFEHIKNLTSQE